MPDRERMDRRGDIRSVELLVVGGESDPNTQRVADQAALRGVSSLVADTDDPQTHAMMWNFDDPVLEIGGHRVEAEAIFMRHNVFRETDATLHGGLREYVGAWPHVRVLNRASLGRQNSKAANLRLGEQLGFDIPETMIVDGRVPLDVPDLDDWVTKPLFGGAYTIPAADLAAAVASGERRGLHLVQRRLRGRNVRVFVVGGTTFAFEIVTDRLDYREVNDCGVEYIPTPPAVVDGSVALADQLGFTYCALDFRGETGHDDLVFLEINSFPMFVRFDTACEHRLVDRMLSVLLDREIGEPGREN